MVKEAAKRELKGIIKYVVAFFALAIGFTALVTLVALLPSERVQRNIENSMGLIEELDRNFNVPLFNDRRSRIDIGTDITMLNIQYHVDSSRPFMSAMVAPRFYDRQSVFLFEFLARSIEGGYEPNFAYQRYWHGWSVWVRPLLVFLNYQQIRVVLNVVFYALAAACLFLIYKKLNWAYTIPFVLALFSAYFITIPMNWQFFSVYLVTFISCIVLLLKYRPEFEKYIPIMFFIVGAATSFMDFLTAPLVAFGLPAVLAMLLIMKADRERKLIDNIVMFARIGVAWILGYILLWAAKWVILDLFVDMANAGFEFEQAVAPVTDAWYAVRDGVNQVFFRMNDMIVTLANRWTVIRTQVEWAFNRPSAEFVFVGAATVVALIFICFHIFKKKNWNTLIFVVCALIPFVWFFITTNHAWIHWYFTFRNISVAVFALSSAVVYAAVDLTQNKTITRFKKRVKHVKP